LKVLNAAADAYGFRINPTQFDFGAARYLRTGETLPDSAVEELRKFDAIYLGAIGHPDVKPGILEKGILLKARFMLDQYINFRPVKLYPGVETPIKGKGPEDINFVVMRENTGGLYTGMGGVQQKGTPDEVAIQVMCYTRKQVDRLLKFAFDYAMQLAEERGAWRGLSPADRESGLVGKVTLVHKTNVLEFCGDLWQRAYDEMAKDYPKIKKDYNHVDANTMWSIKNPEWFDVIAVENMFGDIITDEDAIIQGGLGIAAGGNINPKGVSMFEPMGGSAPKYTGKNVINPLAAIEAGRMLIHYLGEREAAAAIQRSVAFFLSSGRLSGLSVEDIKKSGLGTREIGDIVAEEIV
jgi:3-isopropylmalate dehydrogenase